MFYRQPYNKEKNIFAIKRHNNINFIVTLTQFNNNAKKLDKLPGVGGFEPANGGVKVRCLTTWRHPN